MDSKNCIFKWGLFVPYFCKRKVTNGSFKHCLGNSLKGFLAVKKYFTLLFLEATPQWSRLPKVSPRKQDMPSCCCHLPGWLTALPFISCNWGDDCRTCLPVAIYTVITVFWSHSLIYYFSFRYIFIPCRCIPLKKTEKNVCCGFLCTQMSRNPPPRPLQGWVGVSLTDLCDTASVSNIKPFILCFLL